MNNSQVNHLCLASNTQTVMCKIVLPRGLDYQILYYEAGLFEHSPHDFIVITKMESANKVEPSALGNRRNTAFETTFVLINTKTANLTLVTYKYPDCTNAIGISINETDVILNPGMCYFIL